MDWQTFFLYLSPVVVFLYLYINKIYSYWSSKGVSGPPNIFPIGILLKRFTSDPVEFELDMVKKYGKVYGIYNGVMPGLTIADPELAKTVLVKDFQLFMNRRDLNIIDKHWKLNLSIQNGDDWKRIRSIVTRGFSTGKLRKLYPLLKRSVDKLEKYLEELCENPNEPFCIKDTMAGFTIDVIASTAFGTDADTNGTRDKSNPFLRHGQGFFLNINIFSLISILTLPKFMLQALRITHPFRNDSYDFFVNAAKTMVNRSGKRDDFISMLKEANVSEKELKNMNWNKLSATSDAENFTENETTGKEEKTSNSLKKFLTDDEIVAQCFIFFLAGFETTSSALTNTFFHLARDQAVQDRLYNEITEKLADIDPSNLEEYYEQIQKLPYLEAILKETLRLYPPTSRLERRVGPDNYKLGGIDLQKDDLIEISIIGIHYNEEWHPNPHTFDPSRFMPENKHKLVPYSYIPFGDGPRNCVGMRFAYQEAKICLASLIQRFRIEATDKTPAKLQFPKKNGLLIPYPFETKISYRI